MRIKKGNLFFLLVVSILFTNTFFIFKWANFYWWSMYLFGVSFLGLWLLLKGSMAFKTIFKLETYWGLGFLIFSIFSIIINQVNFLDGIFVIMIRVASLLMLGFAFYYAFQVRVNIIIQKHLLNTLGAFYFSLLAYGLFQSIILGYDVDDLTSYTGSAHRFSYLLLLLNIVLIAESRYKKLYSVFLPITFYLLLEADFKLGLLACFGSLALSFLYYRSLLLKSNKSTILIILLLFTALVCVVLFFISNSEYLPYRFKILVQLLTEAQFDTNSVFPPNLELFKGYKQLFTSVFSNWQEWIFGVGPGNYATNIAISKEKHLAYEYVIRFRDELDRMGMIEGTLLHRRNAMINIIAEFGLIGSITYLILVGRMLLFPVFMAKKNASLLSTISRKRAVVYSIFMLMVLLQLPFLSTLEEGVYISSVSLLGFYLLVSIQKDLIMENGK